MGGTPATALLALSISMNSPSVSVTPEIFFSSATAFLSASVQVGDLKFTVSLRIAAIIIPATFGLMATPSRS